MCTLPSTLKGTAKVLPGCGVKINYLYYWSDTFATRKSNVRGSSAL